MEWCEDGDEPEELPHLAIDLRPFVPPIAPESTGRPLWPVKTASEGLKGINIPKL